VVVAALECRGYRNLADQRTELGPGIVVLHGPNAAGKSNLLEAVHFGLTGTSFRGGHDRDLIRFDEPSARVELELEGDREATVLAGVDRGGQRRHVLDGRPVTAADRGPVVSVFHPDRLQLVKGPPAHRRAQLDRLIAALWPARADLRGRFGRTLAQRNALVYRVRAGQAPESALAVWDERLAAEAEPLIAARAEAVDAIAPQFSRFGSELGLGEAALSYRPRAGADRGALMEELARRRSEDLGRAYMSYGPQLDELELKLGGRPIRRFGSQGQQRLALLALLFAERGALLDAGREAPVMLLDDVTSELDPERRALLVDTLSHTGQSLLTATESEHVPAAGRRIAVRDGATTTLVAPAQSPPAQPGAEAA
jgi:DNA replication and repair protein RecF